MNAGSILSRLFQSSADEPLGKVVSQYADDVIKSHAKRSANQIAAEEGNLIATHQLSADKLAQAAELGGFVQPSMAVVDPSKATNFLPDGGYGEILMVANRNAIDPKRAAAKTFIGDRDIYSPRFPRTSYNVNEDRLDEMIQGTGMSKAYAKSNLDLDSDSPMYDSFVQDLYKHQNPDAADLASYDLREREGFKPFANDIYEQLKGQRDLIHYTPSGKQNRLPLTAENASKIMNKVGSVGTEQGMQTPYTRLLNDTTKRLPSLDSLYKNKYRLIDTETGEQTKDALTGELARVASEVDELGLKHFANDNPYTQRDYVMNFVADLASGQKQVYPDPSTIDLPPEMMQQIQDLGTIYRDLPVNYFEAKPRRVVNGDEFYGAYIPQDASHWVEEYLNKLGVSNIKRYVDPSDLDLQLAQLAKEGKRGVNPYVLGTAGAIPTAGILSSLLGGQNTEQEYV